jgi:ornithine cyclodeaminase
MKGASTPKLKVITGSEIAKLIEGHRSECVTQVERAYLAHGAGKTVNPHSSFLLFPDRPTARIIALPAYLGGEFEVAGIKWIASYPQNVARGIARASATLVLNDTDTGYPFAFMESSLVSAARTAASAVLAAERLHGSRKAPRMAVIGNGLIARHVLAFFRELRWSFDEIALFDLRREAAEQLAAGLRERGSVPFVERVTIEADAAAAFRGSDLVVLATVAGVPHIHDPAVLAHKPLVLHLSLRDLAPELILSAHNIADDVDHLLRQKTSAHLAEQAHGNRSFMAGTIADVLRGELKRATDRATIFSPFGLGILDLAVGRWVYERAVAEGLGIDVPDFFAGTQ